MQRECTRADGHCTFARPLPPIPPISTRASKCHKCESCKNLNDNFWQFDDASGEGDRESGAERRRRKGSRGELGETSFRAASLILVPTFLGDGLGGAAGAGAAAELLLAAGGDRAQVFGAEAAEQQRGLRRDIRGQDGRREERRAEIDRC